VKLADEEHVLFFMPHHSVFDGWSWAIFQRELFGLYDAFVAGKPSPFQNLPIQYADFACLQREWLKGEEVEVHPPARITAHSWFKGDVAHPQSSDRFFNRLRAF
jgi:hypothetical protein